MGNRHREAGAVGTPIEDGTKGRPALEPICQVRRLASANAVESVFGPLAGGGLVALPRLVGKLPEFTIPFDGELIADRGTVSVIGDAGQFLQQLLE